MAYRSLKRVLGETSLERKCRISFGLGLALVITIAFWYVESTAERMVMNTTRQKGRDLVDNAILLKHFGVFLKLMANDDERPDRISYLRTGLETIRQLDSNQYQSFFLGFEPSIAVDGPDGPVEMDIMKELRDEVLQFRQQELARETNAVGSRQQAANPSRPAIFKERLLPSLGEYHFFQPVYWDQNCFLCHEGAQIVPPSEVGSTDRETPFRVVKIVMPYEETQAAIRTARSWLITIGIGTVTAAMVLLYLIVHRLIVKPLKHLRDVSDEIVQGNTQLRAEIQTNDEFEELADSFNRMLRHLIDAQANLQQVNKDLDAKIAQLAQANMRLYEMNRLKGDFLANMSHELRTPLNSIIGFSEVLQGIDSLNDRQKRYARNIQKSGRVLLEMINDILDLAKMEAGKMELRLTEFRIGALIHSQCDLVRSLTDDKNIDLDVEVDPHLPTLYQDQGKVQQILTNLLSNAIKFTPEGGRICVAAQRGASEHRVRMTVTDTGVGIAKEDRDIVFEKFRQGAIVPGEDNLTREYSGTGLGLSIVKELCTLLGGDVSFESEVGKGSSFMVEIPVACADQPRLSTEIAGRLDELAHTATGSGGRMAISSQSLEANGSSPVVPPTPVAHDAEP